MPRMPRCRTFLASAAGAVLLRVPAALLLSGRSARRDSNLAAALNSQPKQLTPVQARVYVIQYTDAPVHRDGNKACYNPPRPSLPHASDERLGKTFMYPKPGTGSSTDRLEPQMQCIFNNSPHVQHLLSWRNRTTSHLCRSESA